MFNFTDIYTKAYISRPDPLGARRFSEATDLCMVGCLEIYSLVNINKKIFHDLTPV